MIKYAVANPPDVQVQVKGSDPILEGELFNDIAKDDSSWTIGMVIVQFMRWKLTIR
jgi:hypothetical protein